jgi:hypothetical protein
MLVHQSYWDDNKQRAIRVISLPAIPTIINYTVNVWTKYREDMDQAIEQIRKLFDPDLEINTKFNTYTKSFLVEEIDKSEIEVSDTAERVLRKSLSVRVEAYIPTPKFRITSTGKIEEFKFDIKILDR